MGFNITVSPIAKNNVREAIAYYKKEVSVKAAQNFVKDYELTLNKIKQNPYFQIYYKDFRGLPLKKYPYVIFYQVDETQNLILVKAVFNAYQDTKKRPDL
ncbi:MAG: type II toxin-antitoxin system RelE/ParE family toxin [Flavobacteriaceae bacterium]|jgi:plasmid stabilization system protein ParE|nr:type II toxin-antitoxin system RelE/ParE family toxin [Flavobacteriaceae bacterium]